MNIAFVLHFYDKGMPPEEMVKAHYSSLNLLKALVEEGHNVYCFYPFNKNYSFKLNRVNYIFIKSKAPAFLPFWHPSIAYNKVLKNKFAEFSIDIIHANNPYSYVGHYYLNKISFGIPYIIQDHSGKTKLKHKFALKYFLQKIDKLLFSSKGQETPWVKNKVIANNKIQFVMEASSELQYSPDHSIQLKGDPKILWVGNLNENKNPIFVINALEKSIQNNPNIHLTMIYKDTNLLEQIKSILDQNIGLSKHIDLVGFVPRDTINKYFSEAEYFIAASYKEGSGYALLESLSCGCVPILSNIPTFNDLTHNGTVGHLYKIDQLEELTNILSTLKYKDHLREEVITHFNKNFSYKSLAKKLTSIYRKVLLTSRDQSLEV